MVGGAHVGRGRRLDFAFPWPTTQGEWLAWASAVATTVLGLLSLFAPRFWLAMLHLQAKTDHTEGMAGARGRMAGFCLGVGLCAILLAQPLVYLTLGVSWILTAFGRGVSMLSDRGNTVHNWVWLVVEVALGALPLAFVFGILG